jgi:hypothetical protein
MSGTRRGVARAIAIAIGLGIAWLLFAAAEADGAKYSVAQCGWHIDADAAWADTTGGAKFRSDAYCATPSTADPFDGAHLKSFTRGGGTVSGTRFARWRWAAPEGTSITRVSGTWWHTLHDGFEQRIGAGTSNGGFSPFASAAGTDVTPRDFVLEDRLLCARSEAKWCSLEPGSWSAVRALTITLEDNAVPATAIGGDLIAAGWRRGAQNLQIWGGDIGSGLRFGETLLDGARVGFTEYPCSKALIGSEWRGTRMRPCELGFMGNQSVTTTNFSDGPHKVSHCIADFAGSVTCTPQHTVLIDNNAPVHPRSLALVGGDGWRRLNDFDLSWQNPDQGAASPIAGASWRILGPYGFDSGAQFAGGRNLESLKDLRLLKPGVHTLQVWLRDEAGNEAPSSAISIPLRLDDIAPGVAFDAAGSGQGFPDTIGAAITDEHSGPASGDIFFRRLDSQQWAKLPTKFQPGETGTARLIAALPESLAAGTYVFRAEATDAAGNSAATTKRSDGTEMALRKLPVAAARPAATSSRGKARIFARLHWRHRLSTSLTVPFGAAATLTGRLLSADGAGLAGRELRVVSRPSRGALSRVRVDRVSTGEHGGFRLQLGSGPSRKISVSFAGSEQLEEATRSPLSLRVRGGVDFHATPRSLRTGEDLKLRGRVRTRGAPLPRRGKLVAIQYFEAETRRWRPVIVVRSDHSGRFHARYRFRYITGTARIRLRAVSLPEERWPYAPGVSHSLVVRVSG